MKNLKIGDIVKFNNLKLHKEIPEYYPTIGSVGIIKEINLEDNIGLIKWLNGFTKSNNTWWVDLEDIKIIYKEKYN